MRTTQRGFLPSLLMLLSAAMPVAVPLSASNVNVIFYDNRYGTLNDSTGAYTQIATLPVGASGGVAGLNGLLYLEDFGNNLFSVDPVTGAAHLAGNTGLNLSMAVFGGGQIGLFELDYASNLYSINASTGKASLVGSTGLAANNGQYDTSLSSDGTSLLYTAGRAGANDELYRINRASGAVIDLGSTGVTGIAGSAFVNGNLELYQYGQDANYIYSASVGYSNAASATFRRGARLNAQIIDGGVQVGNFGSAGSNQLGAAPEPPSVLLFGAGVFFALLAASRVNGGARIVMPPIEPVVGNYFDSVQTRAF